MTTQLKNQILIVLDSLPDQLAAQVLDFAWYIKERYALNLPPQQAEANVESQQTERIIPAGNEDIWDTLAGLTGVVEAPADWALEHDHYLYGTPKQSEKQQQ